MGVDHTRQNRGGKPIVIAFMEEVIVNEAGMKEKKTKRKVAS